MTYDVLLEDFNDESEDNKKIIFERFTQLEKGKSLKVEAYPGSGKTYLITKLIKYVDLKRDGYVVLSHMNSSISTLESNLKLLDVSNPKVQTLVSFFISYFLVPLGFKISNENPYLFSTQDADFLEKILYVKAKDLNRKIPLLNSSLESFIKENLGINKNFGESDIGKAEEWGFIKHLIMFYLKQDKYLEYFILNLKSKGINYIFFDEYQDTDEEYMDIVKKMITSGGFIFYITGDINQSISYNQEIAFDDVSDFLDETEIEIYTQPKRFSDNSNIFDLIKQLKANNFRISGNIHEFNSSISRIEFDYSLFSLDNLNLPPRGDTGALDQEVNNFIDNKIQCIEDFITTNASILIGKNNVILTFLNTDTGIGEKIIADFKEKLNKNNLINVLGGEKIMIDFRLPKLVERIILFIQDKNNSYKKVERELKFIIKTQEFNFADFLTGIINMNDEFLVKDFIENVKKVIPIDSLKKTYSDNNKFYNFLDTLTTSFGDKKIKELDLSEVKLYDLFKISPADKINISINTIHSSKGKEYDNVIVLELLNAGYTKAWINESIRNEIGINQSNQYRNMYYVGLSRAKERIFTCIDL